MIRMALRRNADAQPAEASPDTPGSIDHDPRAPGAVEFVSLTKSYRTNADHRKFVLQDCNMLFPAGSKIALFGSNGAGKSTLLRIISGAQDADAGRVVRYGSVSWPIGFGGSFHPDLTGAQNTRFVGRVHGVDTDALLAFVHDFTELKDFFFMPFRTYSSGMRARLAFAVSMGVPFDCYLVDEVTSVGDQGFRDKCQETFQTRLRGATAIVATHGLQQAKNLCDSAAVLHDGHMTYFEDIEEAIEVHQRNMKLAKR